MSNPNEPHYHQAPPLNESELRAAERPKAVDTAYLLWLIAAGISVVANLLGFVTQQAIVDQYVADSGLPPEIAESAAPGYGSIIFSLVIVALWVVVVLQMRKGANWARIVLTVLGALSVLGTVVGVSVLLSIGFLGVVQALLGLAGAVVIVGAIVFMFKPESSRFFKVG
jgi:hypothetical protein